MMYLFLQASQQIRMADEFYAEGKIYVVLAVLLLLWGGFMIYVWRLNTDLKNALKQ